MGSQLTLSRAPHTVTDVVFAFIAQMMVQELTLAMQTFDSLIPKTMSALEADLRWPKRSLNVAMIGLQDGDVGGCFGAPM